MADCQGGGEIKAPLNGAGMKGKPFMLYLHSGYPSFCDADVECDGTEMVALLAILMPLLEDVRIHSSGSGTVSVFLRHEQ